ncbi:MAG: SPOR domain-containing protein [Gemmatimonadota bacterium]|nr:SPOR domain-containing protein [Gemmatimonadota bacterium]
MRTSPLALALVLAACHGADKRPAVESTRSTAGASANGPDQLVLRFPRSGGVARAFAYPRLDSVVWSAANKAPALARLLGFDDGAGSVLAEDTKGGIVRIDLRRGDVTRDPATKLSDFVSADGSAAYGVGADGSVTRLTPAGSWTFKPPTPAHDVVPQPDGTLLVLANRGEGTMVWLIRPPEDRIADSVLLPRVSRSIRTPAGDRVYFPVDSGLVGVRGRDLQIVPSLKLPAKPRAVVTSPSGDRIYVAADSSNELLVVDRYSGNITTHITLPSAAIALRMDPTGRYVLARASAGDTAYVISVSTDRMVAEAPTQWRADLPAVAPNGWLALVRGKDVVLADAESLAVRKTIAGGAADDWLFISWNGFRPRAASLDQPVTFESNDTVQRDTTENPFAGAAPSPGDTLAGDSTKPAAPPAAPPAPGAPQTHAVPIDSASKQSGFTVQFAALRAQEAANDALRDVHVQGATPRLVATTREGVTIYRVVIGPFNTREEADRIARTSGKAYWIYEGAP